MLILTRRIGEAIVVEDNIQITVLSIKGNQVRLGINAPKSVTVHRKEIYERIKAESQTSGSAEVKSIDDYDQDE